MTSRRFSEALTKTRLGRLLMRACSSKNSSRKKSPLVAPSYHSDRAAQNASFFMVTATRGHWDWSPRPCPS